MTGQRGSIYIADGYGNHRVVVFSATGTYLRQWGGVAGTVNFVTDSPGLFASGDGGHPHCITIGNDGLVYVCDRADDRIQVFTKTGALQRIIPVVPGTGVTLGIGGAPGLGTAGSAWDLAFSNDSYQTYMFEVDGGNEILHIMDRVLGTILDGFGTPGLQAGQFTFLHSVALDSKGNLYTGETINGRRVQKFVPVQCDERNWHRRRQTAIATDARSSRKRKPPAARLVSSATRVNRHRRRLTRVCFIKRPTQSATSEK